MLARILTGTAAALMLWTSAQAAEISGAGSTFVYPVLSKWSEAYSKAKGSQINYQSIGSGGGIQQINSKTVDFGASDAPLSTADLEKNGQTQFPIIMGGVVPVVNLDGIKPGDLKLDGAVLGDIFLGKIKKWDDKAIADLNPGLKLPSQAIAVVHRSDGSGTTFIFTNYLSKVNAEWKSKVGENTAVEWPTGLGGKGNEGIAAMAGQTKGSIGYVEYAYALQNNMTYAIMKNKDGKFVKPEAKAFAAAASGADWANTPGFAVVLTDQAGADSWPIVGVTYAIIYKKQDKPAMAKEVLDFFDWAYKNGTKMAEDLQYIPMPASVVSIIEGNWKKDVTDSSGKPVWTGSAM